MRRINKSSSLENRYATSNLMIRMMTTTTIFGACLCVCAEVTQVRYRDGRLSSSIRDSRYWFWCCVVLTKCAFLRTDEHPRRSHSPGDLLSVSFQTKINNVPPSMACHRVGANAVHNAQLTYCVTRHVGPLDFLWARRLASEWISLALVEFLRYLPVIRAFQLHGRFLRERSLKEPRSSTRLLTKDDFN